MASILRQGIALSGARYIEQVIMLLTPVVLVRTIGPTSFGEYRLFWLLVTTVGLLFPFDVPRSLLFFFVFCLRCDTKRESGANQRREDQ